MTQANNVADPQSIPAVPVKVFVVCCGGLGGSQMGDIIASLRKIPGVWPWSPLVAGFRDEYKEYLANAFALYPAKRIALIAHSFGGQTALETCNALAQIPTPDSISGIPCLQLDYLELLDPVSHDPLWAESMPFPTGDAAPALCHIFRAANSFPVRPAAITGGPAPEVVSGTDHNSLCHDGAVIAAIVGRIQSLANLD